MIIGGRISWWQFSVQVAVVGTIFMAGRLFEAEHLWWSLIVLTLGAPLMTIRDYIRDEDEAAWKRKQVNEEERYDHAGSKE